MAGDFEQRTNEQLEIFDKFAISSSANKLAIDLGAGHGIQSVALASVGFKVKAIDFSKKMLQQLAINRRDLPVEIIEGDFVPYLEGFQNRAEVILCMGDAITHLPNHKAVYNLIRLAHKRLTEKGKVLISFRDLTKPLENKVLFLLKKMN